MNLNKGLNEKLSVSTIHGVQSKISKVLQYEIERKIYKATAATYLYFTVGHNTTSSSKDFLSSLERELYFYLHEYDFTPSKR